MYTALAQHLLVRSGTTGGGGEKMSGNHKTQDGRGLPRAGYRPKALRRGKRVWEEKANATQGKAV